MSYHKFRFIRKYLFLYETYAHCYCEYFLHCLASPLNQFLATLYIAYKIIDITEIVLVYKIRITITITFLFAHKRGNPLWGLSIEQNFCNHLNKL